MKTVSLQLTDCQIVLLWLLHTNKSLFIQYGGHKFENFVPKKLTVCQYCRIMVCLYVEQPVTDLFVDYTCEIIRYLPYSLNLSPSNFDPVLPDVWKFPYKYGFFKMWGFLAGIFKKYGFYMEFLLLITILSLLFTFNCKENYFSMILSI